MRSDNEARLRAWPWLLGRARRAYVRLTCVAADEGAMEGGFAASYDRPSQLNLGVGRTPHSFIRALMRSQTLCLLVCSCVAASTLNAQPSSVKQLVTGEALRRLLPTGKLSA